MAKTYRELLEYLQSFPEEKLDLNVTIYVEGVGEYFPLDDYAFQEIDEEDSNDILDTGHPYFKI